MISRARSHALSVLAFVGAVSVGQLRAQVSDSGTDIVGLWKAKRWFDPDAKGPLLIQRNGTTYTGDMIRVRNPYGGAGMGLVARDFMKFGQLMLDDGAWQGRRILSSEFVHRASSTLTKIGGRDYGLLWWPQSFTVGNRTIRGFAALGNGGQIVMVFPELKLVVATNGGSYGSRGWRFVGGDLMSKYILPAVRISQ